MRFWGKLTISLKILVVHVELEVRVYQVEEVAQKPSCVGSITF